MFFIVIEHFKNRNAPAVYRRFREKRRMAPDRLTYVDSWIEANFDRCFQLMECNDLKLRQEWIRNWGDLADLEVIPVVPSKKTSDIGGRRL